MKLAKAAREYVQHEKSLGRVFETEAVILKSFVAHVGSELAVRKVRPEAVLKFLNGRGPITSFWHRKYQALSGFWVFAIARAYTDRTPLPSECPKEIRTFVPYIYSHEELRLLLAGTSTYQSKIHKLERLTFRTILLLLYGAGLRISEALNLTCSDVNLGEATITIRDTKFYKTRRIAASSQLCAILTDYDRNRRSVGHSRSAADPFFTFKNGDPVTRWTTRDAFLRLRRHIGLVRRDCRCQPRLHDLRHSFAVHRVVAWYRSGTDVQRLLPGLATHLGHGDLSSTQCYLTMIPELLAEASLRFERYATEVIDE